MNNYAQLRKGISRKTLWSWWIVGQAQAHDRETYSFEFHFCVRPQRKQWVSIFSVDRFRNQTVVQQWAQILNNPEENSDERDSSCQPSPQRRHKIELIVKADRWAKEAGSSVNLWEWGERSILLAGTRLPDKSTKVQCTVYSDITGIPSLR